MKSNSKNLSRLFLIAIFVLALLEGCGGGGGGGSSSDSGIGSEGIITISGTAVDDPIAGGNVSLIALDGSTLATGMTDADGQFSLQVNEADIQQGYELTVTGGQTGSEAFTGELRALYDTLEDRSAANITLITTLITKLSENEQGDTPLERRDAAIRKLADIGMVQEDEWSDLEPASVDMEGVRARIGQFGLSEWINKMAADLADDDLSPDMMTGFPNAHGGIVEVSLVDPDNRASVFPGSTLNRSVQLIAIDDSITYRYEILDAPEALEIDENGNISYDVSSDANGGETIPLVVKVTNTATGKARLLQGSLYIMSYEVIASGVVGPQGGRITDDSEGIVIDIPEGAVDQDVDITIVSGRDAEGDISLEIRSSGDTGEVEIYLPDPQVLEQIVPIDDTVISQSQSDRVVALSVYEEGYPTKSWVENRYYFYVGARLSQKELTIDLNNNPMFSIKPVSILYSTESLNSPDLNDKTAVLFIHGYLMGDKLGGGEGTWGDFPARVRDLLPGEYLPFEFRWRTNARFQDVAEDLRYTIDLIAQKTGKEVHIIAHSFGGILARVYLQRVTDSGVGDYERPVASVTTVGTPHSGIADSNSKEMYGEIFMDGQDGNWKFYGARQISVYQMGEPMRTLNDEKDLFGVNRKKLFGLEDKEGFIAASIANTSNYSFPEDLPIQVLIGLIALEDEDKSTENNPVFVLRNGDGLITYSGQRFHPALTNSENTEDAAPLLDSENNDNVGNGYVGDALVTEHVLGTDQDARPDQENVIINGYGHNSVSIWPMGAVARDLVKREVELDCMDTDTCNHATFLRVKSWLETHEASEFNNYYIDPSDTTTTEITVAIPQIDTENGADNIQMYATVVTQNGKPLENLAIGNFALEETIADVTSKAAINTLTTSAYSGEAISTAIVIDRSGSMGAYYDNDIIAAKEAAKSFVANMSPQDQAAVIDFAGDVVVKQDFTSDKNILNAAIDSVDVGIWNGTATFDATYQACNLTFAQTGQKVVVVLTDGEDNASFYSIDETISNALLLGIPVYTIGLGVASGSYAEQSLIDISDGTNAGSGGSGYYYAPSSAELKTLYDAISGVLSSAYIIGWNSSGSAGDAVTVKITVDYTSANGTFTDYFTSSYIVP